MPLGLRPGPEDSIGSRSEIRSALTRFFLVGFASLVLVATPTMLLFQNIAMDHALETARENGRNLADRVLAPQTTTAAIAGNKAALSRIDATVRARMLDGSVARIKIWDLNGKVIYSDEPALIGRTYPLPEAATLLNASAPGVAEVSPLDHPENEFDKGSAQLVEVYTLARASTGEQLLFETYYPISLVNRAQHDLLVQMAPVGLSALVILALAQLPSALHLARQVQHSRLDRQRLLLQTVAAADHERRRLAQELHDDVIQDLAGVGYALSSLDEHLDEKNRPAVARIGGIVRRDVERLRAMVTGLYPRDLDPQSLANSLSELGSSLREAGVRVGVEVDEHLALDETRATLVYRVARECLHNAERHARPHNVDVRLGAAGARTVLTVVDDGQGFDPAAEPPDGHFGLKLIRDTVTEAGGTLLVDSLIGRGTRVELSLPHD